MLIGCDYHPGFQEISCVDTETGEELELRLKHREEAEQFYGTLAAAGTTVRIGMEASGHARWFERLMAELKLELWIADAALSRLGGRQSSFDYSLQIQIANQPQQ